MLPSFLLAAMMWGHDVWSHGSHVETMKQQAQKEKSTCWEAQPQDGKAWVFGDCWTEHTLALPVSRLLKETTYSNGWSPYHLGNLLLAVKYILIHTDLQYIHGEYQGT